MNNVIKNKQNININAIISIICSGVSLLIFWWLSAIGIGLGIRSLKEIKVKNEKGIVLSFIGIILGMISLTLYVISVVSNQS